MTLAMPAAIPAAGYEVVSVDPRRCWGTQGSHQCYGVPVSDLGLCDDHLGLLRETT